VAVVGGDGTMGRLLDHLADLQMPILIVPSGTANNIASSIGVGGGPPEVISRLPRIETKRLDIGAVVGPFGARNFLESVGFGVFAATMNLGIEGEDANERLAKSRQAVASALATHEPKTAAITIDGERVAESSYLFVEISSIRRVGPALPLVGDAAADDGILNVVVLAPENAQLMVDWLMEHDGQPPVHVLRGRSITVESEDRFRIDDKEIERRWSSTTIDVTTGRAGLRIMVPAGDPN
jgi:diacylglycerol kinase family enzyme